MESTRTESSGQGNWGEGREGVWGVGGGGVALKFLEALFHSQVQRQSICVCVEKQTHLGESLFPLYTVINNA